MLMMNKSILGIAGAGKGANQGEGCTIVSKGLHQQLNTSSSWAQPSLLQNR